MDYEAMKAAFTEALETLKPAPRMISIDAFDAEDDGGDPVTVVAICDDEELGLKFVVIEEDENGEIYPIVRSNIYRKGASQNS